MVYAVSLGAQKDLIDKYCFDECGKICMAGLNICGGAFLPCNESNCPHMENEKELEGTVNGDKVVIRKLHDLPSSKNG